MGAAVPEGAVPNCREISRRAGEEILPFWIRHAVDRENGGFHGTVDSDLTVDKKAPRAAVINARILWTFSVAARVLGKPEYREMADQAWDYIIASSGTSSTAACTGCSTTRARRFPTASRFTPRRS